MILIAIAGFKSYHTNFLQLSTLTPISWCRLLKLLRA